MKRHNWIDTEVDFLLQHYATMPTGEIAKHLGITRRQVTEKACNLKLKKEIRSKYPRKYPDLTDVQKKYLYSNYAKKTSSQIAKDLGINNLELKAIIQRENLQKKAIKKEYAKKEIENKYYKHPLYYNQIFGGIVGNEILKK